MFDSLRLMPVSRAQMKWWTKSRMGVAVLEPGTRRKDEPHAQELGFRSLEGCGGKISLNDPDALVGLILFAIDEKLIVTFELFRRIQNIYSLDISLGCFLTPTRRKKVPFSSARCGSASPGAFLTMGTCTGAVRIFL